MEAIIGIYVALIVLTFALGWTAGEIWDAKQRTKNTQPKEGTR